MKLFSLFFLVLFSQTLFADELIIEPDAGRQPILSAIHHADSSIELVTYGFTDQAFTDALIEAQQAHKEVAVLLEPHPYKNENENANTIRALNQAHISLQWPSENFKLVHQKTLIFDHRSALVMTFNFTHATFKHERNFALLIDNPALVKEIDRVFQADRAHQSVSVTQPDLVWSPDNAREKILRLIHDANSEINIYAQDLSDYQIVGALAKAARSGVKVKVLLSVSPEKFNSKKFAYLERAGVQIRNSQGLMIHAKVIMIDQQKALLGSINLTAPSIKDNRELSVVTHDSKVMRLLLQTFAQDWNGEISQNTKRNSASNLLFEKKNINWIMRNFRKLYSSHSHHKHRHHRDIFNS